MARLPYSSATRAIPEGSSATEANSAEVASASIGPSQSPSTTSKFVAVDLTLGGPLHDRKREGKLPWDFHALGIVFGMIHFGCSMLVTYYALRAHGFICRLEDIEECIKRNGWFIFDEFTHPVDGNVITTKMLESGIIASETITYVDSSPRSCTYKNALLRARAPLRDNMVCPTDGLEVTVQLKDGELTIRVLDQPDLEVGTYWRTKYQAGSFPPLPTCPIKPSLDRRQQPRAFLEQ